MMIDPVVITFSQLIKDSIIFLDCLRNKCDCKDHIKVLLRKRLLK